MSKQERKYLSPDQKKDKEVEVKNAVYQATVKIFESLEHEGVVFGNGHHMAQKAAEDAAQLLRSRWQVDESKTS